MDRHERVNVSERFYVCLSLLGIEQILTVFVARGVLGSDVVFAGEVYIKRNFSVVIFVYDSGDSLCDVKSDILFGKLAQPLRICTRIVVSVTGIKADDYSLLVGLKCLRLGRLLLGKRFAFALGGRLLRRCILGSYRLCSQKRGIAFALIDGCVRYRRNVGRIVNI